MERSEPNRPGWSRRDLIAGATFGAIATAASIEAASRVSESINSKPSQNASLENFFKEEELSYGRLLTGKAALEGFIPKVDFKAFGIEDETAELIDFITQADWEKMRLHEIRAVLDEQGVLFTSEGYPDGSWKVGFARSLPFVVDHEEREWSVGGRYDLKVFGNSDAARKVLGPVTGVSLSVDTSVVSEGEFYRLPEGSELIARAEINKGLDQAGDVTETIEIYDAPDGSQTRLSTKLATESARQFTPASYQVFSINKNSNTIGHLGSDAIESDFSLEELLGVNPRY